MQACGKAQRLKIGAAISRDTNMMHFEDCEMTRPPHLMLPGDVSYPSDGGMVAVGVHAPIVIGQ